MNVSRHDTSINVCRMIHKTIIQLTPQNFCYHYFYCCYHLICTKAARDFLKKILLF